MSQEEIRDKYFRRLEKLKVLPLLIFLAFTVVFFTVEMIVIYNKLIPSFLEPLEKLDSPIILEWLRGGFLKIANGMIMWAVFSFFSTTALIYTVWNLNKFIALGAENKN